MLKTERSNKRARIDTRCNICFDNKFLIKCSVCVFKTCEDCIYTWAEKSFLCPQCKEYKTYDIDYPMTDNEGYDDSDNEYLDYIFSLPFLHAPRRLVEAAMR